MFLGAESYVQSLWGTENPQDPTSAQLQSDSEGPDGPWESGFGIFKSANEPRPTCVANI